MPSLDSAGQMEVVRAFSRGRFRHVLFDFDGTISLLRSGWQDIMAPMMLEMICGDIPPTAAIESEVHEYIETSTGLQTILQMEALAGLVRKHGIVGEEEVLEAREYKAIYRKRLMEPVSERLVDLAGGKLTIGDVTVRGALDFMAALKERGATLDIFSGTDREDVRKEAGILGADAFADDISGALDSYADYSKEGILRELLENEDIEGHEVLVVGDGPVEIQQAKAFGCVALGVASDEEQGFGWNAKKRARLIDSGADVLVADFGNWDELAHYLFDD